jgi:formylglycine-generating enzyme required for sulfatase activity
MNKIHALLVGVSEYEAQEWRLECPPEDARKLAGVLEEHYGADTVCLDARDLDAGKLERELKALCKKSKAGDTVLFFFSGHGRVVNDKHYLLLPGFDAELLQRGETSAGVFTLGSLEKFTRKPGVQRLFIFDACRTRQKVGERGQHHGAPDTGVVQRIGIAKDLNLANSADVEQDYVEWHACGDNQISLEWSRKQGGPGHSLFASALIKRLRDAANRGQAFRVDESVGKVLRQDVRALARQIQREADCGLPELSLKSCVQGIELAALRKSATENVGVGSSHDERQWLMLLDDLEFVGSAEEKIALLRAHINDPSISGCVHVEEVRERILALRQQIAGQGPVEAEAQARLESDRMADEQAKAEAARINREAAAQRAAVDRLAQERQSAEQAQTRVAPPLGQPEPNKRFKQLAIAAAVVAVLGGGVYVWSQRNTPAVVLPVVTPIAPVVAVSSPAELQAQRRAAEQLAQQQAAEKAQAEAQAADQAAWNAIQNSSNAEDFKAYLQQYPQGQYLKQARARIKELSTLIAGQALERDSLKSGGYAPELVFIPASTKPFTMGSDDNDREKPPHPVTIGKGFALGKYEVTVGEYLACVRAGGCPEPLWREAGSKYHYQTGSDDLFRKLGSALSNDRNPIVGVSWNDAGKYVNWLSAQTGQQYRLPSEAEWEYACRAGGDSTYCAGENPDLVGWYYSGKKFLPVGDSNKKNAWGLYDMSGNALEWVEDCYIVNYRDGPKDENARGNHTDTQCSRVLRGSNWVGNPLKLRSANRSGYAPSDRGDVIGFRIARTHS